MKSSSGPLLLGAVALAMALPLSLAAADTGRNYIEHKNPPGISLPFSDGVRVGNTLYVAGHIGVDPNTGNAPADTAVEARLLMDAVKRTVESAGFKMDDFVSVTVFCTDVGLYDSFNGTYRTYFHEHYPARGFIGVAKLVRGAHFEVLGIAVQTRPQPHP